MLFNTTELLINNFVGKLRHGYHRTYGDWKNTYSEILVWAGSMALENIANSDALYHNVEHTIIVTLTGQEIIRGKHIREGGVSPDDWLHYIISLLFHEIGYVHGVCSGDRGNLVATGIGDEQVELRFGSTDASLMPYHVDRGKRFVEERFGGHQLIDVDVLKRNLEMTRFPLPAVEDDNDRADYPALVRAADLLGPLSDPCHLHKLGALFYELAETGMAAELGYHSPGDLRAHYVQSYWDSIDSHTQIARGYLELTQQGKQVIANLHANLFTLEQEQQHVALRRQQTAAPLGTSDRNDRPTRLHLDRGDEGASLQETASQLMRLLDRRRRQGEHTSVPTDDRGAE